MLYRVQMWVPNHFASQKEVLAVMAEGDYQAQLYEVIKLYSTTRYRLEFTRDEKVLVRVQAKHLADVMDAVFLGPAFRFRLMWTIKTVTVPGGFW